MDNNVTTSDAPQIIHLQPGDVIVATFMRAVTNAEKDTIIKHLENCFPHHNLCLFHGGSNLRIVRAGSYEIPGTTELKTGIQLPLKWPLNFQPEMDQAAASAGLAHWSAYFSPDYPYNWVRCDGKYTNATSANPLDELTDFDAHHPLGPTLETFQPRNPADLLHPESKI